LLGGAATASLAFNGLPGVGDTVTIGTTTYTFVAATAGTDSIPAADAGVSGDVVIDNTTGESTAQQLANTLANLAAAVNGSAGAGTVYGGTPSPNALATASVSGDSVEFTATAAGEAYIKENGSLASTVGGSNTGGEAFLNGGTFSAGSSSDLLTAQDAQEALANINAAIQTVASLRGNIGAGINRLQSASNVITNQVQNLTSAENGITAADIPSTVANLTKYSILEQTGVAALSQANQMQQLVLKLLQ